MPASKKVFGSPRVHSGKVQTAEATHVPIEYLAQLHPRKAIPVTVSTSIFRIDGGANAPVIIWNGKDYFKLNTTLTFTSAASYTGLDPTSGAITAYTSMSTGVWYLYAGIIGDTDTEFSVVLYPSKVAPLPTGSGEYGTGWYIHPGTAKENYWNYVGWVKVATAGDADTEAVFTAATKRGYWYEFAAVTSSQTGQSSAAATADFSASIPVHECEVAGYLSIVGDVAYFAASSTPHADSTSVGFVEISFDGTNAVSLPFSSIVPGTAAAIYTVQSPSDAAVIGITRCKDVV